MNFDRDIPSFRTALAALADANPSDEALVAAGAEVSVVTAAGAVLDLIATDDPDPARLRLLGNAAALIAENSWLARGAEASDIAAEITALVEPE